MLSGVTDESETKPPAADAPPVKEPPKQADAPAAVDADSNDVTVEISTDDNGFGTTVVSVVAFDVTDADCSDGSEVRWDWDTASTTKVSVQSSTKDASVTVTLKIS